MKGNMKDTHASNKQQSKRSPVQLSALRRLIPLLKILPLFALGGCSAVQVINSISQIHSATVQENIAFDTNPRLTMDLYLPSLSSLQTQAKTPVIVFFYGGSWNRGEKSEYEFVGRRLASMGYIAAIPNYRVYPEAKYPQFLEDGAKASAKVLQLMASPEYKAYKPDNQLIMMGHSAGAYNAAMLAMDDRWLGRENLIRQESIKGLIGLAGAYNIYPICVQEVRPVFDHPNYPSNSQPIDYVSTSRVPTLLLTPEEDELVSTKKNSLSLHQALLNNKTPSQVVAVKGTDHITVLGTLSPILFFKGDSLSPIQNFVQNLSSQSETWLNKQFNKQSENQPLRTAMSQGSTVPLSGMSPSSTDKSNQMFNNHDLNDLTKLPNVQGLIKDIHKPVPTCKP